MSVPDSDAYVGDDGDEQWDPDDGGDGGDDDSGGGISGWKDLSLPGTLQSFLDNPRNFILGAVLTSILEGVFSIVSTILDALLLAFGGSQPFSYSPYEDQWGLADVPPLAADYVIESGDVAGTAIFDAIRSLNDPLFNAAGAAGPFGPVLVAAIVAAEVIALLWIGERVLRVIIDVIPGGGGLV